MKPFPSARALAIRRSARRNQRRLKTAGRDSLEEKDTSLIPPPTRRAWGSTASRALRLYTPVFAASTRRTITYFEPNLSITSTGGVVSRYFLSANGAYDPNITGTGHQPLGFDQIMLMYEQYTVVRSKISLIPFNNTSFNGMVTLSLTPDTTALSDPIQIVENGLLAYRILQASTSSTCVKEIDLDCDVSFYFGRTNSLRELLNDTSLHGSVAANPTEQVYFCINMFDPFATNTLVLYFAVIIEYDVVFFEPRKLTVS